MQILVKDRSETIYGIGTADSEDLIFHTRDHDFKYLESERDDEFGDITHFCTFCNRELNEEEIERL